MKRSKITPEIDRLLVELEGGNQQVSAGMAQKIYEAYEAKEAKEETKKANHKITFKLKPPVS